MSIYGVPETDLVEQAAKELYDTFLRRLGPLGFTVGFWFADGFRQINFDFRFKSLSGWCADRINQQSVTFYYDELVYRRNSLSELAARIAVDVVYLVMEALDPPLPPAPEVDWRPPGAIPEDYYS